MNDLSETLRHAPGKDITVANHGHVDAALRDGAKTLKATYGIGPNSKPMARSARKPRLPMCKGYAKLLAVPRCRTRHGATWPSCWTLRLKTSK